MSLFKNIISFQSVSEELSSVPEELSNKPVREKCELCDTPVYSIEKLVVDDKIYHSNCFICQVCKKRLGPIDHGFLDGCLYCRVHLVQKHKSRQSTEKQDVNAPLTNVSENTPSN